LSIAYAKRGSGPNIAQIANVRSRPRSRGNEIAETRRRASGSARAALRLGDHLDDLREQACRADALGAHHEAARAVDRPADHGDRRLFSTGIGSPVTIDSSTALRPSSTTPSTGTFSPGRTRSRSPACTASSGTSLLVPSARFVAPFRRQPEQRA
jgi:hypothetical protein